MSCVVYSTDGNALDQCHILWSVRSLLRHVKEKTDIVILCNQDLKSLKSSILLEENIGDVTFLDDVEPYLDSAGLNASTCSRKWPFAAFYRLAIPLHPFFRKYSSVTYFDTDTLVLSDHILDILHANIGDHEVGGVPDTMLDPAYRLQTIVDDIPEGDRAELVSHGLTCDVSRAYINSGVLVINLDVIRKNLDWYKRRVNMFSGWMRTGKCSFPDQDFINAAMHVYPGFSRLFNWFVVGGGDTQKCIVHHYCGHSYDRMLKRATDERLI